MLASCILSLTTHHCHEKATTPSTMAFMFNSAISSSRLIGRHSNAFLSRFHTANTVNVNHSYHQPTHRQRHRPRSVPHSPRISTSTCMSLSMSISTSASTKPYVQLPSDPVVGFIGLGVMGFPMLNNLAKTFNKFIVWNRTPKDLTQLTTTNTNAEVELAVNPADVVQSADITFSMLSTPEAVRSVFYDCDSPALASVTHNTVIVDCSTLQQEDMMETYNHITAKGGAFLEAPVSGSKGPAEQGQLIFLCAGDKPVFDDPVTQSAFEAMGKRSFYLGDVGNGTKMKLVVNQLMATMLAALGESIVLAEAVDLSVPDLLEILYVTTFRSLGAMNNPMFGLKGPKMQHGIKGYDTNFPLEHAQKDVRFAQSLGDEHGVSMSVSSAANEWYKASKGLGLSRDDFCAVIESIRAAAGRQ